MVLRVPILRRLQVSITDRTMGPEAITPVGLAEKTLLAPDDIGAQRPFGGIVGHRHGGMIQEGPKPGTIIQQFAATATGLAMAFFHRLRQGRGTVQV